MQRAADEALEHESPVEELFEEQIACADLVVLTKCDLLSSQQRRCAEARVQPWLREGVRVVGSSLERPVPNNILLGLQAYAEHDLDSRPSHHDGEEEHDGVRTAFADIDLSEGEAAVEKLFSVAESELHSPSILINNAGFQHVAPIEDFSAEIWERMLALHTSAPFYAIKRALPAMRRAEFGRIVNIVSVQGLVGSIHKAGYVTSKHGLTGLTKVTALETAEANITCNAICPGFADTELARKQVRERAAKGNISEEQAKHDLLFEKQPSLAFVPIEDIAEMVCYLCSAYARHITGASLSMDGGWFAR